MANCFGSKPVQLDNGIKRRASLLHRVKHQLQKFPSLSSRTSHTVPPAPSPTVESLRASLETLPQELYDEIVHYVITYDETAMNPLTGTTLCRITATYKPPVQLQINRKVRAAYAPHFYSKSTFYIEDPNHTFNRQGKKWLASLDDATCALLTDVRHPNPGVIVEGRGHLGKCSLGYLDSRASLQYPMPAMMIVTYGAGESLLSDFKKGDSGAWIPQNKISPQIPTHLDPNSGGQQLPSINYPGHYSIAPMAVPGYKGPISKRLHRLFVKAHRTIQKDAMANFHYRRDLLLSGMWEDAFGVYEANDRKGFRDRLYDIEFLFAISGYRVSLR